MLSIAPESPLSTEARALIAASDAEMRAAFAPGECFTFSPEELARADTRFYVARRGGGPLGCVAMVARPDYAEVKRLLVLPEARGMGVGRQLMAQLETGARALGLDLVRLETGPALSAAMALYMMLGYLPCAPFGGYPDIPSNAFLEKRLG